ncbi:MAG: 50S ribosomal protein L25/general stress protein Ctc [Alphaproteobacteria bacterium]|nr:50S ribosomal protein L25/general stress protein Ctc [Alphaproteobacteria bacterium]TAD91594.1 MAG: 50S ribosomal protein L25/general stress protein Ctc [Alphaproteobacteria bacterium]
MTQVIALSAEARDRAGKGAARAVRRSGRVPGVIYGGGVSPVLISVDPRDLLREMHKPGFRTHLFDVQVGSDSHRVMAKDVQFHPVTDRPAHVDFLRVAADATIQVMVPVVFKNMDKSIGLKKGGVLNIVRHEVELLCRVDSIPEALTLDISAIDIGTSIHISAFQLPEGVRPTITDRDFTVATIVPPTKSEAA